MSFVAKAVLAGVLALGVGAGGVAYMNSDADTEVAKDGTLALTIKSANGTHAFTVERARTQDEQARGLMFRTDLKPDGGMLFWPYPPTGGAPVPASFWMKNTPSSLDILYIRADGTIARIAENTVPFSETPIPSGEPVGAVLELMGGRAAELGIAEGDLVTWDKGAK
ncbi:DUF192 domain-containing protein [Sphingomonas faeni]|nr:DUF192 domain-containing protein [Sphingomonas faeni]MCP8890803.1 DUF192 domain-containing protein [Sphingomonas faeni]